jgi:hypothetical protein
MLITTTSRITSDRHGILGRVWRRPGQNRATADDERQYWLPDGPPGKLVVAGRIAIPPSGLAWSTTGTPRKTRRGSLTNPLERRCFAGNLRLSRVLRTARLTPGLSLDNLYGRSSWARSQSPA